MARYVEVRCPHCGAPQQAANRCIRCDKYIIMPLNELVQSQIQKAYNLTGRNAKAAAKLLGVPYRTFWYRLREYSASKDWSSRAMGHLYKSHGEVCPAAIRRSIKAAK